MRYKTIHIALSVLLTIAFADFTWQELLEDQVCINLEVDSEKGEKLREGKEEKSKYSSFDLFIFQLSSNYFLDLESKTCYSKSERHGNYKQPTKLYLLFNQLKLHC